MPTFYDSMPDHLREWVLAQPLFYTASAPLYGSHVNISPKGLPAATFAILNPNRAAYIDSTGSGSETIAHVYENGRVTIMFASFEKGPRILRFFCTGTVIEYDSPRFPSIIKEMGKAENLVLGARAVIVLDVFKVQTSCGFGVPLFTSPSTTTKAPSTPPDSPPEIPEPDRELTDRSTMNDWASKMIKSEKLRGYQAQWNSSSLDGLPGLRAAMREKGERVWWQVGRQRVRGVVRGQWEGVLLGLVLGVVGAWIWGMVVEMIQDQRRAAIVDPSL